MADEFFLDYQGADMAATRFARRSSDLAGAAAQILPDGDAPTEALVAAADLRRAYSGRLFALSDQLQQMSTLVSSVVRVTNDVEVDLTVAP